MVSVPSFLGTSDLLGNEYALLDAKGAVMCLWKCEVDIVLYECK